METPNEIVLKKPKRLTSAVWNHFERIKNADICYAICVHCNKRMSGSSNSGTTHLRNHLMRCLKRSNFDVSQLLAKRRKKDNTVTITSYYDEAQPKGDPLPLATIKYEPNAKRVSPISVGNTKFDQERSRIDLARMIILHGYPLAMVDHIGFKVFLRNLQPMFDIATNSSLELDCLAIYASEKHKVQEMLHRLHGRICVAVDLWNSPENARYLCLTAQYIDQEWKFHKRILNFVMIDAAHTEDIQSEVIIKCLMDWDIERRIFSITFGDLFTSDDIVSRIKDHLSQNKPLLLDGRLFDVRCAAHTLRLLVGDAMDGLHEVILKIRDSINYVKSTQAMQGKFNDIARKVGIDNEKSLFVDCPMRWDSTTVMLETALAYRAAFSLLQEHDSGYLSALTEEEWEWVNFVSGYLKLFVEITNVMTNNKSPTSNIFFPEICDVHVQLVDWCHSSDEFIKSMTLKMKAKFDLYWNTCSLSLAIAVIVDPRFKMKLVEYYYPKIYGDDAQEYIKEVSDGIRELFNEYLIGSSSVSVDHGVGSSANGGSNNEYRDRLKDFDKFLHESSLGQNAVSDLDKYLEEPVFPRNHDFNIFDWWKVHTPRYPILSMMVQDVLGVPMSTVNPELAYRTGDRVLDQYRSSLSSETVQALICTQDWLQSEIVDCRPHENMSFKESIPSSSYSPVPLSIDAS
ncbi:hypothetical protein KSS87_019610 [Heliosperma pusillum]|nr:hypothetical protein KSS87_019610 [Heliosperma pusillum]